MRQYLSQTFISKSGQTFWAEKYGFSIFSTYWVKTGKGRMYGPFVTADNAHKEAEQLSETDNDPAT